MKKFIKYIILFSIISSSFALPVTIGLTQSNYTETKSTTIVQNNYLQIDRSIAYAAESASANDDYVVCEGWGLSCAIISFMYRILVIGGNFLVGISAMIMDFFLQHSIQSATYKDQSFIAQGWEIIRDITNIVFIFALIIISFNLVLGTGGSDIKRRLIKVILISLTINFSLFGVFMIIDTSNILAHVFYNKIENKNVDYVVQGASTNTNGAQINAANKANNVNANSVSLGIADQVNPQSLLTENEDANNSQKTILILIIGAINIAFIYVFLSVSFLFLGRTIGLWISAVLVPLAFASITIPGMEKLEYVGFGKWLNSFLKMAFMAPVFLFFLYLAVEFMKIKPNFDNENGNFLKGIMQVLVPMAAIVVLILASKKVADKMSGDFAGTISGIVVKGVAGIAGVGLGAGAMALSGGMAGLGGITKGIGMGAEKVGLKKFGKTAQSLGSRMGRTKTIDVTKIPGFGRLAGMGGVGGAASYFSKNIAGQSGKSLRQKAELGMAKMADGTGDGLFGGKRGIAESNFEHKKAKDKINEDAQNWEKKLNKEKDKHISDQISADQRNKLNADTVVPEHPTGTPTPPAIPLKVDRKAEKDSYREVIANPLEVKKEEKELKDLNSQLKDLTAVLNAAKATGTPAQIVSAENEVEYQKIMIDARKKGRKLNKTEAEDTYLYDVFSAGISVKEFTKNSTKNDYIISGRGSGVESYLSDYESNRDNIQKKEITILKAKINKLRSEGKDKEATLLSEKINDIITNSERDHKKGSFDKEKK